MTATQTRKTIQTALKVTADGVFGPKTRAAFNAVTDPDTRKFIQRSLGFPESEVDGIIGPRSHEAFENLAKAPAESEWPPDGSAEPTPAPAGEFDSRTEANLATLNAKSQALFRPFLHALIAHFAAKGIVAKIISGTRTFAEQDALYAKGRTAPGPKVTNARGGQSNHNFGCAADIGLFKDGDYLEDSPLYKEIGAIAKSFSLQWGGDWSGFKDLPHVEAKQFKQAVK